MTVDPITVIRFGQIYSHIVFTEVNFYLCHVIQVRLLTIDNLGHSGTENVTKTLFHKEILVRCNQESRNLTKSFQNDTTPCVHCSPVVFDLSR